ncbi:response regulator [Pigmentiphaga sp.]|uniref:sensor histidine kinase n=1 Tax=Pigmentiphaga sp. TaxID=1977564 RepID=UPI00128CAECA|nr:response regulator [Pigmentiphaga sp.]MPS29835.1 response regulator [Alcaligenaceae bacterium SAGV5]MPS50386.1 response regulator [Alcaligenaceae bacterium SAGV3]MPT57492.1 response regulator [Alcaligenaceae bacterium]
MFNRGPVSVQNASPVSGGLPRFMMSVPGQASAGLAGDPREAAQLAILFIEDSLADFTLMRAVLVDAGLNVAAQCVDTETTMRQALAERAWDAIISDHSLPTFSGLRALKVAKEAGFRGPFLIVSGAIGEETAVEAMRAGADDYVMKNNLRRLPPALERGLREVQTRDQRQRAETALASAHDQLNAVFSATPVALFAISRECTVTMWSPACEDLTGLGAADTLSRPFALPSQPDTWKLLALVAPALDGTAVRGLPFSMDSQGEKRELLVSASPLSGSPPSGCVVALSDVTHLAHAQAELSRSESQLRELSRHTERVRENERAELAREIHDDLGALVTRIRADLALARRRSREKETAQLLDEAEQMVASLGEAISRIARAMRPPVLDFGIVAAIEWQARDFAQHTGITVNVHTNQDDLALELEQSIAIFRIFQEALTNVFKHAHATRVDVDLFADDSTLSLEVRDNGIGLSSDSLRKRTSFGLRGMMERVHGLGGWMDIGGSPQTGTPPFRGTTLMISIPLNPQDPPMSLPGGKTPHQDPEGLE